MCFEYHRVIFHWKKIVKIFENIIWSQKYFTPPSFVTNSIFTQEFFQWILCLERVVLESDTTLCRVKFEEARFLPNVVKKNRERTALCDYEAERRHYTIYKRILVNKVQEQGSMHHRPVQQLQSGQSFSQRSKHAGHSLYLYLHFLSIWPFPPPPHLPNGHFGAFYTPIDLGKQFVYNVIGSQKVAMVLAFEPNFLQNLIFLKQD